MIPLSRDVHVNTPIEQMMNLHREIERKLYVLAKRTPKRRLEVGYLNPKKNLVGGGIVPSRETT